MIHLSNSAPAFEVDAETRTIRGFALPYNATAKSNGRTYKFSKGTVRWDDPSRVKLLVSHDPSTAVGYATELEDRPEGLFVAFKVARGPEGDHALSMAEDRVWDGLSVGIADGAKFSHREGVFHAVDAPLLEASLTPFPSFTNARITSVAAERDDLHTAQGITAMTDHQVTPEADESVNLSAVTDAIREGFESLRSEGPTLITPTAARFEVTEEPLYRFDGMPGKHDFSTDLFNGLKFGDREAMARVEGFIKDAFAPRFDVDSSDVTTLNPTRQRPDMYVDQKSYTLPFYNAIYKGTLADSTPFAFPKFSSASGLVADHAEGVEPTPGTFTATNQTVTPAPVSGRVEITRETWDQGGNPQVSSLIWNKMTRAYFEALESKAVAVLDAASPTGITLTTAATGATLVNELEDALAGLQFIRGGSRFNFAGTQIDLYKRLAAAADSTGRKLLPILGATNSNGQARSRFASLDVAGVEFAPAWSLGAAGAVAESSYLVDTDDVHAWNSAPQRLEFQYRTAYVDLAIWGYVATAISDISGVREVIYDPTA